jgi:hypothetical protein
MAFSSKHPLPSAWETRTAGANNQAALRYLKVDGLQVKYVGPGDEDQQAASIRANHPCPPDLPIYYFEVEVRGVAVAAPQSTTTHLGTGCLAPPPSRQLQRRACATPRPTPTCRWSTGGRRATSAWAWGGRKRR